MNIFEFTFSGVRLNALPDGALYWPEAELLAVSDLHLGKSERIARRSGRMLPPYETIDTLSKLDAAIAATDPACVICLGDSFDDLEAGASLPDDQASWLTRLMAGRRWIWIEGNHDPGPLEFGGSHLIEYNEGPLQFRHIALTAATGEVSGHFHPKTRLSLRGRQISRPCFLFDQNRLILPAFGTYTGGLRSDDASLQDLMASETTAILTGPSPCAIPMARGKEPLQT
ncbi:MAG: ligase-associated DNA damage response endonuclease PdeM [Litoreibacter sp.]|nr:ligase-associated DNA damage response endonuclease PdeM [Litoreibacter sp.]